MVFFGKYISFLGKCAGIQIESTVDFFLSKYKVDTYLDCGCGDGVKTISRAGVISAQKILGNEIIFSERNKAKKNGVSVYNFDLNFRWPFKNGSVDVITATEVVEHLVDLDNFFSEVKRVLKSGGKIILSTENLAAYHNIFALIIGNQPYTGPYLSSKFAIGHRPNSYFYESGMSKIMNPHLNVMTAKALEQLLIKYGFTMKASRGIGFYPLPSIFWPILNFFDKYHSSYIVVLASK